jgi:nucleoside-diphosphate-sugar epimerase
VEHFAGLGWRVLAVSRRPPEVSAGVAYEHLPLDLLDGYACRAAGARFEPVTHIVYAALQEKPGLVAGWRDREQMQTNLAMMRNLMDPLLERAGDLRHVSIFQGTKAYGVHLHPVELPLRENRPRDRHENFYWLHEDFIRERAAGADWTFTIWRPQVIYGGAIGAAMNLIPVLGVYAAICRELGLPFACPGEQRNVGEAVDADLIAEALAWAADAPGAKNETFNISNGDAMIWCFVWPVIAESVGLQPAFGAPLSLAEFLPKHAETWDRIVAKHDLRRIPLMQILGESHHYADILMRNGPPEQSGVNLVSTIKLRAAGFAGCIDTEAMFRKWLRLISERRIIPKL